MRDPTSQSLCSPATMRRSRGVPQGPYELIQTITRLSSWGEGSQLGVVSRNSFLDHSHIFSACAASVRFAFLWWWWCSLQWGWWQPKVKHPTMVSWKPQSLSHQPFCSRSFVVLSESHLALHSLCWPLGKSGDPDMASPASPNIIPFWQSYVQSGTGARIGEWKGESSGS